MADVCYDAITGSSYVSDDLAAGANIVDKREWVKFIQDKISANELQPVHDNRLFGEVLELLGVDTDIVNYFSKDIHQISAQEALAFRNSVYASVADDKFLTVGTEADTNNVDIDTTEGGDTDVEVGTDTDGDTDLGDDSSFDTPTEDDDKPADKVKPQIDPERMLLELAKPGASPLTDYLYRSIVAERIDSIIKQPPENARPNDILMLKRWRANWLYLVSVACLRDFLTRISLRLSK
jgi:hypothetical protein